MKKLFLTLAVTLLSVATTTAQKSVFIYAGQSNADGREYVSNLPEYMKQGSSPYSPYRHLKWASICGTPSKKEFGTRQMATGERYAFCDVTNYWIDQASTQAFYAVKCAYGGTAIAPGVTAAKLPIWYADAEWMKTHYAYKGDDITKDEYANYNSLTKNLTEGLASLIDGTLAQVEGGYKVRAIMWHQGESDRNASASYYVNFKTMIAYMRQAIYEKTGDETAKTLPFIFGTVCRRSTQYNAAVEEAQRQVAAEDANVYCIDMKNATLLSDNLHFDRQATEYLGKKMYNLLVELGLVSGKQVDVDEFPTTESVMDGVVVPTPDNRSWDFTAISQTTLDALQSDAAMESGALWNWNSGWGYRRSNGINEEQLHTASAFVVPETDGLYFSSPQGNRVTIGSTFVGFVTGDPTVFIPKMTAGQLIYVTAQGNKATVRLKPGQDMSDLIEVVGDDQVPASGATVCFRVRHNVTVPTHIGLQTSGGTFFKKMVVKTPETVNILIGADRMETFACDKPLDFSPFTDLFKAYIVTGYDNATGTVYLEQVEQVPAATGVVLIGEECTVNVPVIEGDATPLPAPNLLTAVVGQGEAPAGSYTLATSHGTTRFCKTATAQTLTNEAYLLLPDATREEYATQVVVRREQLAKPTCSVTLSEGDVRQARCTLTSDNSKLKNPPAAVTYYYIGGSDASWQPIEGNVFTPKRKDAYRFKAVAEGYDDSEECAAVSVAPRYTVAHDIDLTDLTVYKNAISGTGAYAWGWSSLPSSQEYGKLASYNAISGMEVQNNKLDARYSYAKGVGLSNNYGYWLKTTEGTAFSFGEFLFYQNSSTTSIARQLVYQPKGVQLTFPSYKTGALKGIRIWEPAETLVGDANGDGVVNVSDVSATIAYILQRQSDPFDTLAADVNGDDEINITDVSLIINIILGK